MAPVVILFHHNKTLLARLQKLYRQWMHLRQKFEIFYDIWFWCFPPILTKRSIVTTHPFTYIYQGESATCYFILLELELQNKGENPCQINNPVSDWRQTRVLPSCVWYIPRVYYIRSLSIYPIFQPNACAASMFWIYVNLQLCILQNLQEITSNICWNLYRYEGRNPQHSPMLAVQGLTSFDIC